MPHLNWRTDTLTKTVVPRTSGNDRDFVMELVVDTAQLRELSAMLNQVLIPGGGELRLSLPDGWAIFWKQREGESRLLIAHPQADEWVATVALESAHARKLLASLENTAAADSVFRVAALALEGQISSVSNLELAIKVI